MKGLITKKLVLSLIAGSLLGCVENSQPDSGVEVSVATQDSVVARWVLDRFPESVHGETTLVLMWAEHCWTCRRVGASLRRLADSTDLVIVTEVEDTLHLRRFLTAEKVDAEVVGIDNWGFDWQPYRGPLRIKPTDSRMADVAPLPIP